jgi:hypothetical protein
MTDLDEKMLILETVGQKWIMEFTMPDGSKNMGMANSHHSLPIMINKAREMGGKNIIITDKTIFFVDDENEI